MFVLAEPGDVARPSTLHGSKSRAARGLLFPSYERMLERWRNIVIHKVSEKLLNSVKPGELGLVSYAQRRIITLFGRKLLLLFFFV